jgi:hypothetical protein
MALIGLLGELIGFGTAYRAFLDQDGTTSLGFVFPTVVARRDVLYA